MRKNKPKRQHYVPQCYLREWVDPITPTGQEPYVWIFDRGSRRGRKKAPSNLFTETDLYTLHLTAGGKDYTIEEALSSLEGRYAVVFRTKIVNRLPLTNDEHTILCTFVAVMLQRTLRHRDMIGKFFDQLIERTEMLETSHNTSPRESSKLRELKKDAHRLGVVSILADLTNILKKMSLAFLCARGGARFVTSDDPCNMFNPELQWQRFYGPGLAQKNVQVTLPLSPHIMLCMSWSALRGYMRWEKNQVQEANRMVIGQCYQYFVADAARTKRHWFRRYPLNPLFRLKVVRHKMRLQWYRLMQFIKYRHVGK